MSSLTLIKLDVITNSDFVFRKSFELFKIYQNNKSRMIFFSEFLKIRRKVLKSSLPRQNLNWREP